MRFTNVKMSESVGRPIEKTLKSGSKSTFAKWVLATCIIVLNSKTSHIYMWGWNVVTFNYTESETKLLYCCMFRLRMSEHGPSTRSNLEKKTSWHREREIQIYVFWNVQLTWRGRAWHTWVVLVRSLSRLSVWKMTLRYEDAKIWSRKVLDLKWYKCCQRWTTREVKFHKLSMILVM